MIEPVAPPPRAGESGFTLVELLVAMAIFAVVSTSLYAVVFATVRASNTSENVVRVSEEARAGLNRMVRETREGQLFSVLEEDRYRVRIDFDRDGTYENPNETGDYEDLQFRYDSTDDEILLNGEALIAGVTPIPGTPIFSYTSSDLTYDFDGDGVTTKAELDAAPSRGYQGVDSNDTELYTNVEFAMRVRSGNRTTVFRTQAQLRNRR